MNRDRSAFSFSSPSDPTNTDWSQPLDTKAPGTWPPHGWPTAANAPAPENGRSAATPPQLLAAITEFIHTTTHLSASQLRWLAFLERWVEPTTHHSLEQQIEKTINTNELILVEAVMQLTRQGQPLKIGHPQTGQSVPIIGLRYSTEQRAYQVAIPEPAPAPPTLVPLFTIDQLHL